MTVRKVIFNYCHKTMIQWVITIHDETVIDNLSHDMIALGQHDTVTISTMSLLAACSLWNAAFSEWLMVINFKAVEEGALNANR